MAEGRAGVFLKCVHDVQQLNSRGGGRALVKAWAADSRIAVKWYDNYGSDKPRYTSHRETALQARYVERNPAAEHLELRLTMRGLQRMQGISEHKSFVRYKMELCRFFSNGGGCANSERCSFAHGVKELRAWPSRHCDFCHHLHGMLEGRFEDEHGGSWHCNTCWAEHEQHDADSEHTAECERRDASEPDVDDPWVQRSSGTYVERVKKQDVASCAQGMHAVLGLGGRYVTAVLHSGSRCRALLRWRGTSHSLGTHQIEQHFEHLLSAA
mmetsp:Transcript_48427/g.138395  ORF Transcript_48427/g.138395 Transcript_48427/m.138395 type:complete len:269 (+) Transcript_48427:910-1716(+)